MFTLGNHYLSSPELPVPVAHLLVQHPEECGLPGQLVRAIDLRNVSNSIRQT
jgi:hypothetical protein